MPRGGKRLDAGRPSQLSDTEWLEIGAECEGRWRAEKQRLEVEAINAHPGRRECQEAADEVMKVPIEERNDWHETYEAEDHHDTVEGILRDVNGMDDADDNPAPRLITIKIPRPYGVRDRIIRDVADEFTTRLGKTVTPSRVRHAWDEVMSAVRRV